MAYLAVCKRMLVSDRIFWNYALVAVGGVSGGVKCRVLQQCI